MGGEKRQLIVISSDSEEENVAHDTPQKVARVGSRGSVSSDRGAGAPSLLSVGDASFGGSSQVRLNDCTSRPR